MGEVAEVWSKRGAVAPYAMTRRALQSLSEKDGTSILVVAAGQFGFSGEGKIANEQRGKGNEKNAAHGKRIERTGRRAQRTNLGKGYSTFPHRCTSNPSSAIAAALIRARGALAFR